MVWSQLQTTAPPVTPQLPDAAEALVTVRAELECKTCMGILSQPLTTPYVSVP